MRTCRTAILGEQTCREHTSDRRRRECKTSGLFASDVQRTVGWSHVTNADQKHVYQSPNAQTAEAEQLPQTLSPLAQVEAICPETTERDATKTHEGTLGHSVTTPTRLDVGGGVPERQSCGPFVASCPVAK